VGGQDEKEGHMAQAPPVPPDLDAMRVALDEDPDLAMRVVLEWFIANPEPDAVPMLVAVEDFTLTLDDGTVETFTGGQSRIVADHELVALAGEHRFRPESAAEDGTAGMPLSQIANEDPDLARRVLEQRAVSMRSRRSARTRKSSAPRHGGRLVARPRSRGRRERHVARATSGSDSGDSDSDAPGEAGPRRTFVVDEHYLVVAVGA
jgi:hypothetical protein